jgi:peptide/nickel transport system permease protein
MIGAGTSDNMPPTAAVVSRRRRLFTRGREIWVRFCRNRLAVFGLALFIIMVLLGLIGPLLANSGPFSIAGGRLRPPSAQFPFGTDQAGRDILTGVLYGIRTSLMVGVVSVLIAVSIGILVGALSGYYRGRVDDLLMRIAEIFQVMPRFILALVIVAIFGASIWGIIFVIGILSWAEIARLLRAEFLTIRERPFVTAARAYGASDFQIIVSEILPNALTPVIVAGSLQLASAVLLEAGLSFIGVGDPTVMSLGTMLNAAQQYLRYAWWTAVFPGGAICLVTLGIALISDGLNDALNPRLKEMGR